MDVSDFGNGPGKSLGFFERRKIHKLLYEDHFPKFAEICEEFANAFASAELRNQSFSRTTLQECINELADSDCKTILKLMLVACPETIDGLHDLPFQILHIWKANNWDYSFHLHVDFDKNATRTNYSATRSGGFGQRLYFLLMPPSTNSTSAQIILNQFYEKTLIEISCRAFRSKGARAEELYGNSNFSSDEEGPYDAGDCYADPYGLDTNYQMQTSFRKDLLSALRQRVEVNKLQDQFLKNLHGWHFTRLLSSVEKQSDRAYEYLEAFREMLAVCRSEIPFVTSVLKSPDDIQIENLLHRLNLLTNESSRKYAVFNKEMRKVVRVSIDRKRPLGKYEKEIHLTKSLCDLNLHDKSIERMPRTARRYIAAWRQSISTDLNVGNGNDVVDNATIVNDMFDDVLKLFSNEFSGFLSHLANFAAGYFRELNSLAERISEIGSDPIITEREEISNELDRFTNVFGEHLELLSNNHTALSCIITRLRKLGPLDYLPKTMDEILNNDLAENHFNQVELLINEIETELKKIDQRNLTNF